MSGERPVPVGKFNTSCASDRNQYLETGELNQHVPGGSTTRTGPPASSSLRGDREARHSTSAINNSAYPITNSYLESGASDFDESRPWSRNGYYERDPPPTDYHYGAREREHRDPYYGHSGGEYSSQRRPADPYYRERDRGYGPYRANPAEFYPDSPYSMYNPPRRGYQTLPNPKPSTNQHLKAYLQEFCVRDPVLYREWYRQYKAHKENPHKYPEPLVPGYPPPAGFQSQQQSHHPPQTDRTRTPLHYRHPSTRDHYDHRAEKLPSGRSSVNGSLFNQSEVEADSQYEQFAPIDTVTTNETPPDRLTPQKFLSGHSIGVITPFGHLLRVSGGSRTVEILHVKTLMKDLPEFQELEAFPGPLLRGRTHKNTVIKFCQKKIKSIQNQEFQADKENLILLWELLILLIRQNGSVVGSDIAELLLKKKGKIEVGTGVENESNNSEVEDDGDDGDGDSGVSTAIPLSPNDPKITQGFCDLLLFGHKNDALEFAMGKGLWGHALFLASKMGEREYGQVMARFANGMAYNHPLQTLYQIMSGRVPSAVTGCLDESFGDWRPHLAMIISNAGIRPDVEQKAFVALGDTLRNKNLIYGSQFCHLMAQSTFSEDSKLGPLLGLAPNGANILEATQMSEIYEFATSLADPQFILGPSFLRAKFNYVKSLIDFGFTFQAFSYCEVIAKQLGSSGNKDDSLRWDLVQVSERLRFADEGNSSDWIQDLRNALLEVKTSETSESSSRRGSSTGISTMDSSANLNTMANNALNNLYDGYPGEGQGQNEIPNQPTGAYEPNTLPYNSNPVPIMQFPQTYNPNQYQPLQNGEIDSNQGQSQGWSTEQQQKNPEVPNWEPQGVGNEPYYPNSQQLKTIEEQKPQFFQLESKPFEPIGNNNNNIYYQPTQNDFGYTPNGITNGPIIESQLPQSHQLPPPAQKYTPRAPPSTTQNQGKRKTVRFEDDAEDAGLRMSRSKALDILTRGESEEGTETSEEEESPNFPVQFKSTYPIDTPLGRRVIAPPNALTLRTSKVNSIRTFPVDRKCCEASEPCNEHQFTPFPATSAAPNFNQFQSVDQSQRKEEVKTDGKKGSKSKPNSSNTNRGGLFGLLWGRRPKNQMILPDDKEPSIVWDETAGVWRNTKDGDDETSVPQGPPPKDSDLMRSSQPSPPQQQPMNYFPTSQQQQQPPEMHYGQPLATPTPTPTTEGPPSFNPNLQQPISSNHQENWGNQLHSLNPPSLNQIPSPFQPSGPQSLNLQPPQQQTPASMSMNKYKLPKSRRGGMRGKYVDILSTGGSSSGSQPMTMAPPSMVPIVGNGLMFVPGPSTESEDFQ